MHCFGALLLGFVLLWVGVACDNDKITDPQIEFKLKDIPINPVFNPNYRIEHAERNTSDAYEYWRQTGTKWIEWPGNITILDPQFPLLKWGKLRAKFLKSQCYMSQGLDFKAYAYKYLHLTWGTFRIATSYTPPMKIPRAILPKELIPDQSSTFVTVTDFEFLSNALLVILENKVLLRIGNLAESHRNEFSLPIPDISVLSFDVGKGISGSISKILTQSCCDTTLTTMTTPCKYGSYVMLLNENSDDFNVYLSQDNGHYFKKVKINLESPEIVHTAIYYPSIQVIAMWHGTSQQAKLSYFSSKSGKIDATIMSLNSFPLNNSLVNFTGRLQSLRLGEEMSFVLWDKCKIWYGMGIGEAIQEGNIYVHRSIRKILSKGTNHWITPNYCLLGERSVVTYDPTGKLGIIDSKHNFMYAIDIKSNESFPVVTTYMDMTLILEGKEYSITPGYDFNNRPKLMYPPRYLKLDHEVVHKDHYRKRLGMRLFPRSVFPSDFMPPFYSENIPLKYAKYGLPKCQSSSITADGSLSQKPKIYSTPENTPIEFTLEFTKFINGSSNPLQMEPIVYLKYLKVTFTRKFFAKLGLTEKYQFKYKVTILPKPIALAGNEYRLNFYTTKSIRCVHQPQLTIWVKITSPKDESNHQSATNIENIDEWGKELKTVKVSKNPTEINLNAKCGPKMDSSDP